MKMPSFTHLALGLTFGLTSCASAEQTFNPWSYWKNFGMLEARQGRFETSLEKIEKALELAELEFGPANPALVPVLLDAATAHRRLAHWDRAQEHARWALALARKGLDKNDELRQRAAHDLANLLRERGKFTEAGLLFDEALTGPANRQLDLDYARLDRDRELKKEAAKKYGKLLKQNDNDNDNDGESDQDQTQEWKRNTRLEAADFYLESGDLELAREQYQLVYDQMLTRLARGHVAFAQPLEGLARVALAQKDKAGAKKYLQDAEALRKKTLGPDRWAALPFLDAAGELYRLLGKHNDSIKLLTRCVKINREVLGKNHPQVARALGRLAQAQMDAGRPAEAFKSWNLADGILRNNFDDSHPQIKKMNALMKKLP